MFLDRFDRLNHHLFCNIFFYGSISLYHVIYLFFVRGRWSGKIVVFKIDNENCEISDGYKISNYKF